VLAEDFWPGCVFLPLLVGTGQQEGAAIVLGSSYAGTEGRGQAGRAVLGGSTATSAQWSNNPNGKQLLIEGSIIS